VASEISKKMNKEKLSRLMTCLKNLATEETVRLEEKNVNSYEVENCVNMIIFSNYELALNEIDPKNRRFFIMNISNEKKDDTKYYSWLIDHYTNNIDYIHYYFKYMVKVDKLKMKKPIRTKEKDDIVCKNNDSTLISFINYLLRNIFIEPQKEVKELQNAEEHEEEEEDDIETDEYFEAVETQNKPKRPLPAAADSSPEAQLVYIVNRFIDKIRSKDLRTIKYKNKEEEKNSKILSALKLKIDQVTINDGEYEYPFFYNKNNLYQVYKF